MVACSCDGSDNWRKKDERQDGGEEKNMFIKSIVAVIVALGIMFWFIRRLYVHHPTILREDSEAKGDQGENKDELDDTQAAEVAATWNLLNPP
jgi:hypothetical protein